MLHTIHVTPRQPQDGRLMTIRKEPYCSPDMQIYTVSGQHKIGRELTLLALIQPIGVNQQAVNNTWLWKLQPAVILQGRQKSNLNRIERD